MQSETDVGMTTDEAIKDQANERQNMVQLWRSTARFATANHHHIEDLIKKSTS